jgi:hypothetical protein
VLFHTKPVMNSIHVVRVWMRLAFLPQI